MDFTTADNIINDAAVELALKVADIADPFGSMDPNIVLLCRLLKRVGRSLVRARDWADLTKECSLELEVDTTSYALPTGFNRMKDQTFWNRTTGAPVSPPMDSQAWQELKARTAAGFVSVPFRRVENSIVFATAPAATDTIVFEYVSNFWVQGFGDGGPTKSAPTVKTDTLWFDETLLVAGLKLAFKRAKGLDTSATQDEFNQAWSAVAGADGAAAAISLTGPRSRFPQMGRPPDTGWGL